MLKTSIVLTSLFFGTFTFAHVELGTYQGQTPSGAECNFSVTEVNFENNVHHPLNERIHILLNLQAKSESVTLHHNPVVQLEARTALFDHDQLIEVLAISGGARASVLKMDHSEGHDGPTSFTIFTDNYKTDEKSVLFECLNLKHIP